MTVPLFSSIDLRGVDVFVTASHSFWASNHSRSVALDFFSVVPSGLLVARDPRVCAAATSQHGIRCAISKFYTEAEDNMMAQERWAVLLYSLENGHRISWAGADVRFLRSPRELFQALETAAADVALDGEMALQKAQIHRYTPDLVAALPTTRALRFVRAVLETFRAYSRDRLDGLPRHLQLDSLRSRDLAGPAHQGLLYDVLLSVLHNSTVTRERQKLAHFQLKELEKKLPAPHEAFVRGDQPTGKDTLTHNHAHLDSRLPPLAATDLGLVGVVVRASRLHALFTQQRLVITNTDPCLPRCVAGVEHAVAVHCIGKRAQCLNISGCARCRLP